MMERLLHYFGLREPPPDRSLAEETRGLRIAMETVADRLGDVAESIREANKPVDPSGIPWEDMARGRPSRRGDHGDAT